MMLDDRFTLRLLLNDRGGFTWSSLGRVDSALRDEIYRRHIRYSLTFFTETGWMRKRRGDTAMVRRLLERLEIALPVESFAWGYDRDRLPEVRMLYEYVGGRSAMPGDTGM